MSKKVPVYLSEEELMILTWSLTGEPLPDPVKVIDLKARLLAELDAFEE